MNKWEYIGGELELFDRAERWKRYWMSHVRGFLAGDVLEVGAGIGANTRRLLDGRPGRWVCLEPDAELAERLRPLTEQRTCEVVVGTLADLPTGATFDAILYIDVLEHIAEDRAELAAAAVRLRPDGRLIVLSPAHPFLFTPFDAAIGHHRRYTKQSLADCGPPTLSLERLYYLDSCGLLASLANRLLLQQRMPTARQIATWDRFFVPVSRWLDPLTNYRLGKSVLAVWRKPAVALAKSPTLTPP